MFTTLTSPDNPMNHTHYRYEGKWALVTGASSGIGRAFAYELAARGANLIFASRSKETLNGIARDVRSKFKVETEVVAIDLAGLDSPERLFSEVQARNRTVRVLINNAGFGSYGKLHENSLEANGRQILLNAFSPAILAQLFLPAMVAARDGAIVNVASTAGFQPTPYMAVYGATKAFVLSFSEALWAENLHTGVRVLALCPGPVDTAFFKVLGSEEPASVGRRDTAENTVKTALSALDQGRSYVISGGPMNYWLSQSGRLVSRSTLARTSEKILRPTAETSRA